MNSWRLPLACETHGDSRWVVIDRVGGCALKAERVRGHMLAALLRSVATTAASDGRGVLLVDGPASACLPRRASGEADSPLVRVAASAGGLDRARVRCRGCRCVAPVTPARGRGGSLSRLRAAACWETRVPTASVVETSCLKRPRCGLTIAPRASWLPIEHCRRRTARNGVPVGLFASTLPGDQLCAADAVRDADRLHAALYVERTP